MSDEAAAVLGVSRRALAQQARQRAVELARDEGARLADGVLHAATALSAISDRARTLSGRSARARALGLECLPDSAYLTYCVEGLRAELNTTRSQRRWLAAIRSQADEVQALLERAIELTSTIDIAGELGLSLDLVTTAQTGARTGMSALHRLHGDLDAVETGHHDKTGISTVSVLPSRPAHWLVHAASQLLPPASRARYLEEFTGELREFAATDTSSRAQLAHALRLTSRAWSLRNALPAGAHRPAGGPDRVRVQARADSNPVGRARSPRWEGTRRVVNRWMARREVRAIDRIQARTQRAEARAGRARSTPAHGHHRTGRRGGIPVNHRTPPE